jgi:hypothetical protein
MLIEQFARALCLRFLALAFGPGAAEFGAVRRGFMLRAFFLGALPELVQIDQISHVGPRHAAVVVEGRVDSIDERVRIPVVLDGYAQAGSIFIL